MAGLLLFDFVASVFDDCVSGVTADKGKLLSVAVAALFAAVPGQFGCDDEDDPPRLPPSFVDHKTRRTVASILGELGHAYVQRACRMDRSLFWKLCGLLRHDMENNPFWGMRTVKQRQ